MLDVSRALGLVSAIMSEPAVTTEAEEPLYYTFQEACSVLNVTENTLRKAVNEGRIPSIKVGPKAIRIPVEGLRELWERPAS